MINRDKASKYRRQLIDCPFCGQNEYLDFEIIEGADDKQYVAIVCGHCGATLPNPIDISDNNYQRLVEKWNHRP